MSTLELFSPAVIASVSHPAPLVPPVSPASPRYTTYLVVQPSGTSTSHRSLITFQYDTALQLKRLHDALGQRELVMMYEGQEGARANKARALGVFSADLEQLCRDILADCLMSEE